MVRDWRALKCGRYLAVVLMVFCAVVLREIVHRSWRSSLSPMREGAVKADSAAAVSAAYRGACVVFHAQHKSAGNTIVQTLLRVPWLHANVSADAWRGCHCQWLCDVRFWDWGIRGCPSAGAVTATTTPRLLTRGYALSMARHPSWARASGCLWVTIFREPVSRLVSAQFYCRSAPQDPLCGPRRSSSSRSRPMSVSVVAAEDPTLSPGSWARHWGNYLLRELLLHPDLAATATTAAERTATLQQEEGVASHRVWEGPPSSGKARSPVWWVMRRALRGGDDPRTPEGAANLAAIAARLRGETEQNSNGSVASAMSAAPPRATAGRMFDVVGIVERWEEVRGVRDGLATGWLARVDRWLG